MVNQMRLAAIEVGVVGLGLMGSSIVVALLLAGHKVRGIAPVNADIGLARQRIIDQLKHHHQGNSSDLDLEIYEERLTISEDYCDLTDCRIVLECVIEDI